MNIFTIANEFKLENGMILPEIQLAYTVLGDLEKNRERVIWICHALTANSNPAEWWSGLVGKGKFFDPEFYCIVCINIPGSCYGSTGPLSVNPESGEPYYHNFPFFTIRDMATAFERLRIHLGIKQIHTLVGGSMGGYQAMEWTILQPEVTKNLLLIATNAKASPWQIAIHETQRMAILSDPTYLQNKGGENGLKTARAIGLLSYRGTQTYNRSQQEDDNEKIGNFRASSYQQYQGEKLAGRFNAYSYFKLTQTMDSHNVGRGRGSIAAAFSKIKAKTIVIAIRSDILYPPAEQEFIARYIHGAELAYMDSLFGHDGFLTDTDTITDILKDFFSKENGIYKQ